MYFVVFCDDWVSTVPYNWLDVETKTFVWPPKNVSLESRKKTDPVDEWEIKNYKRIVGPYGTYDAARKAENDTLDVSTNDEQGISNVVKTTNNLPEKRVIRIPSRLQSTEDECHPKKPKVHKNTKTNTKRYAYKSKVSNKVEKNVSTVSMNDEQRLVDITNKKKERYLKSTNRRKVRRRSSSSTDEEYVIKKSKVDQTKTNLDNSLLSYKTKLEKQRSLPTEEKELDENLHDDGHEEIDNFQEQTSPLSDHNSIQSNNELQRRDSRESDELDYGDFFDEKEIERTSPTETIVNNNVKQPTVKPVVRSNVKTNIRLTTFSGEDNYQHNKLTGSSGNKNEECFSTNNLQREENHTHCCRECRKVNLLTLREVQKLKLSIMNSSSHKNISRKDKNLLPQFPLKTKLELNKFNDLLKRDERARNQYKEEVQFYGDKHVQKSLRTILGLHLTDEFCILLSWTGQKKTVEVRKMEFMKVITEAFREKYADCTAHDIQTTTQSWLQHARDRLNKANAAG